MPKGKTTNKRVSVKQKGGLHWVQVGKKVVSDTFHHFRPALLLAEKISKMTPDEYKRYLADR